MLTCVILFELVHPLGKKGGAPSSSTKMAATSCLLCSLYRRWSFPHLNIISIVLAGHRTVEYFPTQLHYICLYAAA